MSSNTVQLRRESTGFQPDSQYDYDQLASVHIGDVVTANVRLARNPQFHKKGFALLQKLFDNQDHFEDFEKFREWMQIAAGVVETTIGPDGETYYKVKSLAWDKMDEIQFERVYQAFVTVAYEKLGAEWALQEFG